MLLQVDPRTLGENLYLLIGLLLLLVVVGFVGGSISIVLKAWLDHRREEQSWQEHQQERLAPNGQPYPPFIEGVCQECGKGDRKIYHAETDVEFCPGCYDNLLPKPKSSSTSRVVEAGCERCRPPTFAKPDPLSAHNSTSRRVTV